MRTAIRKTTGVKFVQSEPQDSLSPLLMQTELPQNGTLACILSAGLEPFSTAPKAESLHF